VTTRFAVRMLVAAACGGVLAMPAPAGAQSGVVGLERVERFASPVYVTAPQGSIRRLFVVEQSGRIRVVQDGRKIALPFLDISGSVLSGGERGLLSMAFAPNYATSRLFYVYYTDRQGDLRVEEFRRSARNPNRATHAGRRVVLDIPHRQFGNHNGGQLQFGPDRLLYVGTGDGGASYDPPDNAQNLGSPLGKILRIDPRPAGSLRYRVPPDNPFVRRAGARPEVYAYGLRNPFRFSFDRATGALTVADVGQNAVEEVNFTARGRKGMNFGWDSYEGRTLVGGEPALAGHVRPVLERFHSSGDCSITGGYVVRNPSLAPLLGRYVHGDFCTGELRSAVLASPDARDRRSLGQDVAQLSSFGEDARGCIYAASLGGAVFRLTASGAQGACGDQIKPRLRLRRARRQLARRRGRAVAYARCDEACLVVAVGSVRIEGRSRRVKLKSARAFLEPGERATLRLRLSRAGSRAVRRAVRSGRVARARIRFRARDVNGNRSALSRRSVRFTR
jgi:hypothetical protein